MAFEGIAVLLFGTTIIFFHLYSLFKERSSEERTDGKDWTMIINENLANLFFGLGLVMIDVMIYTAWLYSEAATYVFAPIIKTVSLLIIIITVIISSVMVLKVFLVFLQMFFAWAIEKIGLMK